jgi:GDP-L-fucose synthase
LRELEKTGYLNLVTRTSAQLDLTDQQSVHQFFETERPEFVFLAAAKVGGILVNSTYPVDFIRNNLMIQNNVIDFAYRFGAKKLLFLGSSCIYPQMAPQPIKEEYLLSGPLEPTNQWYAVAKIAGIKMCQAYRQQFGFRAVSVMPTNLYGPGDNFDLETSHVVPALIRKMHLAKLAFRGDLDGIAKDERLFGQIPADFRLDLEKMAQSGQPAFVTVWGTGDPMREFLHVDDLARACVFLMKNYESEEIINVGVGKDLNIRDLAEKVRALTGFDGSIAFDRSKPNGTPRKLLDVTRIKSLGWEPSIDLSEGIHLTYQWYENLVSGLPDPLSARTIVT